MKRITTIFLAFICLGFQSINNDTDLSKVTLTETRLGPLNLSGLNNENIRSKVKSAFPEYSLTKKTGRQDGPDFNLYMVNDSEGENIFYISMDGNDSTTVQTVSIKKKVIEDQYGIKVHQTVKEILHKRPNLTFHSDAHYNIYASERDSKIEYRLSGDFKPINDTNFVSENYSVEEWQVDKMYVEIIQWRK